MLDYAAIMTGGTTAKEDSFYQKILLKAKYIIAADSGYQVLTRLNLQPHVLLGDMDSITEDLATIKQKIEVLQYSPLKDKTDTELALELAINRGFKQLYILGGIGSRLDHSLANLYLLINIHRQNCVAKIMNPWHEIQLLCPDNPITITGKHKDLLSLLAITDVKGLTVTGCKWNLQNETILRGSSRGISNYLQKNKATFSLEQGMAFLMKVHEESQYE